MDEGIRQRRRRLVIGAGVVAVLGLGGWSLLSLSKRAIERARERALDCTDALYLSGEGDPENCRQSGPMLTLARMLPWTHEAARQQEVDLEVFILEDQLEIAGIRELDVDARDRWARERVALDRGEFVPSDSIFNTFSKLSDVGALQVMAELAGTDESDGERDAALHAALLLADWENAGRIARIPSTDFGDFAKRAAIVACILGDRDTATARLAEAERAWTEAVDAPPLEIRLIELHCGLSRASDTPMDKYAEQTLRRAASFYESKPLDTRNLGTPREVAMTIAQLAKAQTEPLEWGTRRHGPAGTLYERIDDQGIAPAIMRTPYELRGGDGQVIIADLEAGARRLAELAIEAPIEHRFDPIDVAIRPREAFTWAAFCLASHAASERAWRGQLDEARAIYGFLRELAEREEFEKFALQGNLLILGLHARLDPEAALRIAREVDEEQLAAIDGRQQFMFRLGLALVHEQEGELERAIELAASAIEMLPDTPVGVTMEAFDAGARWTHGALLVAAERQASLELEAPEDLRGETWAPKPVFAYWWAAAKADPATQVGYRWRSGGESRLWFSAESWFLPVALDLLARSAPADRREVWLDTVSADIHEDALDMIRARAWAAERLGDAAAVELWREREAALLERLGDDRAAALYRMLH